MAVIMSGPDIARALKRIAHEILEHNRGGESLAILGIPTRGAILSKRLTSIISELEGRPIAQGALDTTMYRDDLRTRSPRALLPTELPVGGIHDLDVVLVDDVFFSGRTIRAALDALSEHGRPRTVQLAVLVDRGHRELPIRADYVGKNIPTSRSERVKVLVAEVDGRDEVLLDSDPEAVR
jgi:pyrimidine operon attenuation protein/uracil phosphoribosyltransferase